MPKSIKVYGERNTNTNYVEQLISLNLKLTQLPGVVPGAIMKAQRLLPGRELVRDVYFKAAFGSTLGWKHAAVSPFSVLQRHGGDADDLGYLTITKNPYSWLLSLYRRPYHQRDRSGMSFEEFVRHPWKPTGRDNAGRYLASPVQLWNIKNESYANLPEQKTIHATTEQLFADPSGVMDAIAEKFGVERRVARFVNHERSTKDATRNGAYYRDYYIHERWRRQLSGEAIRLINERLDLKLVSRYGYQKLGADHGDRVSHDVPEPASESG